MAEKIYWWRAFFPDGTAMIFCALGNDAEEAKSKFTAEYDNKSSPEYSDLINQIARSEPSISEVKNGTFAFKIDVTPARR